MENTSDFFLVSDHLVVSRRFKVGNHDLLVASFNVLFEKWLKMNVHSKDRKTGVVTEYDGHIGRYFRHLGEMDPAERKKMVFEIIRNLLVVHKIDVLCLQEFDNNDVPALIEILGETGHNIVLPSNLPGYIEETEAKRTAEGNNDLQLIIHRKGIQFSHPMSDLVYYEQDKPSKRIMTIVFDVDDNYTFVFVGTHVTFGKMDVLIEKMRHVRNTTDQKVLVTVLGDMNQEECPEGFRGDEDLLVLMGETFGPAKFSHIDTKGARRLYDHIWTI